MLLKQMGDLQNASSFGMQYNLLHIHTSYSVCPVVSTGRGVVLFYGKGN